ncbi:MAG: sigma-70 family RNA polymerase sigma factor [Phycisphaerales bacterium]|nr:MAG: sigma-70 family RNA polymerase sigma factor [Phycisphaerales bacterium]
MHQDRRKQIFTRLLKENQTRIRVYIRVFVPHCADADDILQEAVLVMWQKFDTYVTGTDFAAWGIGIARNFVMKLNQRRFDKRIKFSSDIVRLLEETAVMDADDRDDDRAQAVQQGLARLSEADAELLAMKYKKGYTVVEIARKTGRPLQGLYKAMARIHKTLMRHVQTQVKAQDHGIEQRNRAL